MTTDAEAYAKAKEDMAFAMSIGRLDLAMKLATLPLTAWKTAPSTDCGCTDNETCIPHARENLGKLFEPSQTEPPTEMGGNHA